MTHRTYAVISLCLVMSFLISVVWLLVTLCLRRWRLRSLAISFSLLMISTIEASLMTYDYGDACMVLAISLFAWGAGVYIDESRRKAKGIDVPRWYRYRKIFFIAAAISMLFFIYWWPDEYRKYEYMIPPEYRWENIDFSGRR